MLIVKKQLYKTGMNNIFIKLIPIIDSQSDYPLCNPAWS